MTNVDKEQFPGVTFYNAMNHWGYSWFQFDISEAIIFKVTFEDTSEVYKGHKTTEVVTDIEETLEAGKHYRLFVGNCDCALLNFKVELSDLEGTKKAERSYTNRPEQEEE
jgi:hypothetical protein